MATTSAWLTSSGDHSCGASAKVFGTFQVAAFHEDGAPAGRLGLEPGRKPTDLVASMPRSAKNCTIKLASASGSAHELRVQAYRFRLPCWLPSMGIARPAWNIAFPAESRDMDAADATEAGSKTIVCVSSRSRWCGVPTLLLECALIASPSALYVHPTSPHIHPQPLASATAISFQPNRPVANRQRVAITCEATASASG